MEQWIHLDSIDSTNEYAKRYIKKINVPTPFAVTAKYQTAGKGQQGKQWISNENENILLSFCFPPSYFYKGDINNQFQFLATIVLGCYDFLKPYIAKPIFFKWVNDIYVEDKKIAGILIENIFQSQEWQWTIIGIGININQSHFEEERKAISLYQLTHQKYDIPLLYRQLTHHLINRLEDTNLDFLSLYQAHLYQKNQKVKIRFKRDNSIHTLQIKSVLENGQLVLQEGYNEIFVQYGDIEFL